MKQLCTFILVSLFVPAITSAQVTRQFTNFVQGSLIAPEFTTNNFKCIGIGKADLIWAGSQYGGLYTYDTMFHVWKKSDKLTTVYINDIKADADSGIWVAQSGLQSSGGNSNIAGGVNYFPNAYDLEMNFYSVAGTSTNAEIQSRNAKALYLDQSYSASRGQLPRPWVAQGTFISSFNTKRGGLNIGLKNSIPHFDNVTGHFSSNSNATPFCESIAGNSQEIWVGTRQNGTGSQILRYRPNGDTINDPYTNTNVSLLPNGFTAQALYFDAAGNGWVGLKAGGLVIKKPNSAAWVKMDNPSRIPAGTAINYNAIVSDEFGNVYIGTSSGLLEYQSPDYYPAATPDNVNAYNLITETDGLVNNNVTGLAYDKTYGRLLIATSGGISFMNRREPFIKGVVFDVSCNLDGTNPYPGFQKKPITGGVTVTLLRNGIEEEVTFPDANGVFELKRADNLYTYTVEVRYVSGGRTIRYIYNNVKNHTLMEPSLIPESLIAELKVLKDKMKKKCFPIKIYQYELNLSLFCADGFDVTSYDLPAEAFYDAQGITTNHRKRVDNLADYYTALATIYNLGGSATDLATDACSNLLEAVDAFLGMAKFGYDLKYPADLDPLAQLDANYKSFGVGTIKLFKELMYQSLSLASSTLSGYPETKEFFDKCIGNLNDAGDVAIEALENGNNQGVLKAVLENLKKIAAVTVAVNYYKENFILKRHKFLVSQSSNASKNLASRYSYLETFDNLYNLSAKSVLKEAKDEYDDKKKVIGILNSASKVVDVASTALDAASALALIPGGQIAGSIAKGLSFVAKGLKGTFFAGALYLAAVGAGDISDLSQTVTAKAGLARGTRTSLSLGPAPLNIAQNAPDSLIAHKNRYNQSLTSLQAVYNASVYDSANYVTKYKLLAKEDSAYTAELNKTLSALWASTDSAMILIPNFTGRLKRVVDSFVSLQYTLRLALQFQNLGYAFDPDKTPYKPGLDSLANEIKLANDSAVNGIAYLVNDINSNGVGAPAYLVQEGYHINFSRVPGASGTVSYTFKNYGAQPQNNVSFKISQPGAGYTITSADSVNVGTINPGQSKQVSFSFTSPANDSVGHYQIDVKAANGSYKDVWGTLYAVDPLKYYTIKDGNWNNPATWSSNAVPTGVNNVYISHVVTVTVDATCKNIVVAYPGNVIVNAGKKINVLK